MMLLCLTTLCMSSKKEESQGLVILMACYKRYYSCINYTHGIPEFEIVLRLFSKRNFNHKNLLQCPSFPPLDFRSTYTTMKLFKNLVNRSWTLSVIDYFQFVRSQIEAVFKLAKIAFSLWIFHRYTTRSVKNAASLDVLLSGLVISLGFCSKIQLQLISEWYFLEGTNVFLLLDLGMAGLSQ